MEKEEIIEETQPMSTFEPLPHDGPIADPIEPETKKRKRKQEKPKKLSAASSPDIEEKDNIVSKVSKRMQQQEKEMKRLKGIASYVSKVEKKKVTTNVIEDEKYQADLNDPAVLKSYSLNAFYFLGVSELEVIDVCEFKDYFLKTTDTLLKLEKMERSLESYGLSQDEFRKIFLKYGKQYFKINERDYARLQSLKEMLLILKQQPEHSSLRIVAYLIDIHKSTFEDKKTGALVSCLSPKLRFEISD